MKLNILSDLHMDREPWFPVKTEADAIVVAGDLYDDGRKSVHWCAQVAQAHGKPVIFVAGNHEYYNSVFQERQQEMKELLAKTTGVYWLDNCAVELNGVRFVGGTLWTNYLANGEGMRHLSKHACKDLIADYRYINTKTRESSEVLALTPEHTIALHEDALRAINPLLEDAYEQPTVIISHHAPALRCLHERYAGSLSNGAFASPLESFVAESMAKLWVFGHLHQSSDFTLGSTRVLSNPRGAHSTLNPDFNPGLIVKVSR